MSEGTYISLGWHEREDLEVVIEYLKKQDSNTSIALWGREMGAVTAMMYADHDLSVKGMVLDSPFSDLQVLVKDMISAKGIESHQASEFMHKVR